MGNLSRLRCDGRSNLSRDGQHGGGSPCVFGSGLSLGAVSTGVARIVLVDDLEGARLNVLIDLGASIAEA